MTKPIRFADIFLNNTIGSDIDLILGHEQITLQKL